MIQYNISAVVVHKHDLAQLFMCLLAKLKMNRLRVRIFPHIPLTLINRTNRQSDNR